ARSHGHQRAPAASMYDACSPAADASIRDGAASPRWPAAGLTPRPDRAVERLPARPPPAPRAVLPPLHGGDDPRPAPGTEPRSPLPRRPPLRREPALLPPRLALGAGPAAPRAGAPGPARARPPGRRW